MPFPWFRFYHEFAVDPKVQALPPAWQRHLIMIFCFHAAETLKTFDDEVIASALRVTPAELKEIKAVFIRRGFILKDWTPRNWDKRQSQNGSSTERTRAYRERLKNSGDPSRNNHRDVTVTSQASRSTVTVTPVTVQEQELERERDKEGEIAAASVREGKNGSQAPEENGEPSMACIDEIAEEIERTWPDSNWAAAAYDMAKSYLPHYVAYGFRKCIGFAYGGEHVNMKRIRGMIEWAQANKVTPDEGRRIEAHVGPPSRAKEKPKTRAQEMKDAAKARLAELKAKGVLDANGELVDGDQIPEPGDWRNGG